MRRSFARPLGIIFPALILAAFSAAAFAAHPVKDAKLPNDNWVWKKPEKDEPSARTMYVKKTGEAVSIRIDTYEVPVSSKSFLDSVREKIMAKPDYAGAEIQLVTTKQVAGKVWDLFYIKRKDEINQEIWGRKTDPNTVFMIIYTGAGTYYQQYYNDFMDFMKQASAS